MSDETPVVVHFSIMHLWVLIEGLHLTLRHPMLGDPLKQMLGEIVELFTAAIVTRHPAARELLDKPQKWSQTAFVKRAVPIMGDTTDLPVTLQINQTWLVIISIQAATRHPDLPASTNTELTAMAKNLQSAIVQTHPEAMPLLELGWDEKYDVLQSEDR